MLDKAIFKEDFNEGFWLWKKNLAKKGDTAIIITESKHHYTAAVGKEEKMQVVPKELLKII